MLVAVTAPIRLAAKTASAVEEKMRLLMESGSRSTDLEASVFGNAVHLRLLEGRDRHAPLMIGFVHNIETDPLQLFSIAAELLESIGSLRGTVDPNAGRWLVAISSKSEPALEAYRSILTQLIKSKTCDRALLTLGDGQLEELEA